VEDDSYLLEYGRYIERNPVRANLAAKPEGYDHSSYSYCASGQGNAILTPSLNIWVLAMTLQPDKGCMWNTSQLLDLKMSTPTQAGSVANVSLRTSSGILLNRGF